MLSQCKSHCSILVRLSTKGNAMEIAPERLHICSTICTTVFVHRKGWRLVSPFYWHPHVRERG